MRLPASLHIDAAARRVRLNPRDKTFYQDPYPAYEAIRAACPSFYWEDYGHWCFLNHADVSALLRDRRFGRQILHVMSREQLGWKEPPAHLAPWQAVEDRTLLALEPPAHTRLRGLVNRAFVSRAIERLAAPIAKLAESHVAAMRRDGQSDLIAAFATPIPVIVIADLLGAPASMADQFLDWSHRMVAMYQFGVTREVEDSAAAAAADFSAYLRDLVAERRKAPREDLISVLIAASGDGGKLDEDELIATCILLLNAGHEATVHTIGNGVRAILEAGIDGFAVSRTPEGAARLTEEVLRFDAPLHMFTRFALEPTMIGDISLGQGDVIGLMLGAANRDPARFVEAPRFDPTRADNPHVSFGAGIHFCIGAPLARMEMQIALPILFAGLPGLRLAAEPVTRDAYHFHGLERLEMRW
jgi:unspecific monooxygenase